MHSFGIFETVGFVGTFSLECHRILAVLSAESSGLKIFKVAGKIEISILYK